MSALPLSLVLLRAEACNRLPNVIVEDHPYDVGYWARRAGLPIPESMEPRDGLNARDGWLAADDEIREENGS